MKFYNWLRWLFRNQGWLIGKTFEIFECDVPIDSCIDLDVSLLKLIFWRPATLFLFSLLHADDYSTNDLKVVSCLMAKIMLDSVMVLLLLHQANFSWNFYWFWSRINKLSLVLIKDKDFQLNSIYLLFLHTLIVSIL